MRISIVGPRSVGKSTISKILAEKLNLPLFSSDQIAEVELKEHGGLDKAIKSGKISSLIERSPELLDKEVFSKSEFVLDLAGGAISSKKYAKPAEKIRELAKNKSVIIGLIPSEDDKASIDFLFEREKNRVHFKEMDKDKLRSEVEKDYLKLKPIMKVVCKKIFFVKDKSPDEIANEIVEFLKKGYC